MSILHVPPNWSSKKAQTALEFLIMISLALVVFTTFYAVFSHKEMRALKRENSLRGESIADKVAYELNLALVQEDGFSSEFQIPSQLAGKTYNLSINQTDAGSIIFLGWGDQFVTTTTAAPQVEGQVKPGTNRIENQEGVLHVSPVN